MNLLIPDSLLRQFLETSATPDQIQKYLSLSGPSVERVYKENGDFIYDIEVTSNRVDAMSVLGVAREASVILPRFGINALLKNDIYLEKNTVRNYKNIKNPLKIKIQTDKTLNPRFIAIVIRDVTIKNSSIFIQKSLEKCGLRPINNIVDISNYVMKVYGQPVHTFDYDQIKKSVMKIRLSKSGEKVKTLDGKIHILNNSDIIMEDGENRIVDLCGIMGAENSSITNSTKNVILYLQNYDPVRIRRTSMRLSHRTDASGLFEKGIDNNLSIHVFPHALELILNESGGEIASSLYDLNNQNFVPIKISLQKSKLNNYLGVTLKDNEISKILNDLGIVNKINEAQIDSYPPSFRGDLVIDVDIIEEIARIYGYDNIKPVLPSGELPLPQNNLLLTEIKELKSTLKNLGFYETYTFSLLSEEQMSFFGMNIQNSYKLTNELTKDFKYLRTELLPSVLLTVIENLKIRPNINYFEISHIYTYQKNNLPAENNILSIVSTDYDFYKIKGLFEYICSSFDVNFIKNIKNNILFNPKMSINYMNLGTFGQIDPQLLINLGVKNNLYAMSINLNNLTNFPKSKKVYKPIVKFPGAVEDINFIIPKNLEAIKIINFIEKISPIIKSVQFIERLENSITLRINYTLENRNITGCDIKTVREKILSLCEKKLNAKLKLTN